MAAANEMSTSFAIINNIPKSYHSCDLRNFFSFFVENSGFSCFHFRHRPEVQRPIENSNSETVPDTDSADKCRTGVSLCCIVKVYDDRIDELISTFNKKHWVDRDGHTKMTRCFIKKVSFHDDDSTGANSEVDVSVFKKSDLNSLIELLPPPLMPNGNVGTPTKYFLDQIKACRLPSSIISKLKLEFPHTRGKRIYSSVDYNYGNSFKKRTFENTPELVRTYRGDVLSENYPCTETRRSEDDARLIEDDNAGEESEEEEWDRHESLHDDVTSQERLKERLFEEKIELKWEKGGSGLVFYTDAQYWDEKEGDFDAKTADDWDIDMSPYYEPGCGDKDSRDFLKMRLEDRLRQGIYCEKTDSNDFAGFEKHTTGFGRRVLESQGWEQGKGVGKTIIGISEPIMELGQNPRDKKGFGYRGEKLKRVIGCERYRKKKKKYYEQDDENYFRISTVYDNPTETDPPERLLRSDFLTKLKFRKEFLLQTETENSK